MVICMSDLSCDGGAGDGLWVNATVKVANE